MSDATVPQSDAPAPKKAPKKVSAARNAVGLVLLVIFAAVAALEWTANRSATAAGNKLTKALDREDGLPSKAEVEKMIGKAPDAGAGEEEGLTTYTYTWSGVIRKYRLKAFYNHDGEPHLIRFESVKS